MAQMKMSSAVDGLLSLSSNGTSNGPTTTISPTQMSLPNMHPLTSINSPSTSHPSYVSSSSLPLPTMGKSLPSPTLIVRPRLGIHKATTYSNSFLKCSYSHQHQTRGGHLWTWRDYGLVTSPNFRLTDTRIRYVFEKHMFFQGLKWWKSFRKRILPKKHL